MANDQRAQPDTNQHPQGDDPGWRAYLSPVLDAAAGDSEIAERRQDPLHSTGGHMGEDEVVDVLNDLLECCLGGEHGYKACAEHVKTPDLKNLLFNHARRCASGAAELTQSIRELGGKPDVGGSMGGALHRGWLSVRGMLAGRSDQVMLGACERGEDAALGRYRRALRHPLPEPVRAMVQAQNDGVQQKHNTIRSLRDGLRASRMGH